MPKKKKKNSKTKVIPFLLGILAAIAIISLGLRISETSFTNTFLSLAPRDFNAEESPTPTDENSTFVIDPEEVTIKRLDSYTFSSNMENGTESIPYRSNWSVEEENWEIHLADCENSSTCTVHSGNRPKVLTLTAEMNDQIATATITIEDELANHPYKDKIPSWSREAIQALNDRKIMIGYQTGEFGPGDPVTRGQFTLLMYRLMKSYGIETSVLLNNKNCDIFQDVSDNNYAKEAICFAYHFDWLEKIAINDNQFAPNQPILRKEVAQLANNALFSTNYQEAFKKLGFFATEGYDIAVSHYRDVELSDQHSRAIATLYIAGFMTGTEIEGYRFFFPDEQLNRAEAATILWRMIEETDQRIATGE